MTRSILETRDNIAIIKFTRSKKLNAFDYEAWKDFSINLDKALGYDGLVITGEGKAFSAGDDIYAMYELKDYAESREFFKTACKVLEKMLHYPRPIVAAVNGLAVGGGAELLLGADYVISVKDAWFWFPEARIGLYPPILITLGTFIFGLKKVKRLSIMMPKLSVEEAMDMGIVDEVVSNRENLIEIAIKRVREFNTVPESSFKYIRIISSKIILPYIKEALEILSRAVVNEEAKKWMEFFIKSREK